MNGDDEAPRRRKPRTADEYPDSLRPEAAQHLQLLLKALQEAELARLAGDMRLADARAQEVVGHAFLAIERLVRPEGQGRKRLQWLTDWLSGALVFPADMRSLSIALEALDRGETLPLLKAKGGGRQGGVRRTRERLAMRNAVEAAREIRERCEFWDQYAKKLQECGSAESTIRGYQSALAGSEQEPRSSYVLAHGTADPEAVLREAVGLLSA